jgi:hypothetical protein
MYAIVEYNDYRKEQSFEVITTTDDVEYAKKVAFNKAMNVIKKLSVCSDDSIYRITTEVENKYLQPINKTIVAYKIIDVEKYKKGFKIVSSWANVYAVIELKKEIENIEEIDTSLICDNYYDYDGERYEEDNEDEEDKEDKEE